MFVDGIRALAALFVVLHHIYGWIYAPNFPTHTGPPVLSPLLYGHLAVAVFMVVSGFSLSIAPARSSYQLTGGIGRFLRRRAWRILPTYWASLIVAVVVLLLVIGPNGTGPLAVNTRAIVVHAALLQDIFRSTPLNPTFWSIAIEWQIYFLFPLLLLSWRRGGGVRTALIVTLAASLVFVAASDVHAFSKLLRLFPQFLALFAFGMLASRVLSQDPLAARWRGYRLGVSALLWLGLVVLLHVQGARWMVATHYYWVDLICGAATACLIAGLASGEGRWLAAVLGGRLLAGLGRFSYSIYCLQFSVLVFVGFDVVPWHASRDVRFLIFLSVGLTAVLLCSYLFSLAFERPFLSARSAAEVWAYFGSRVKALMGPSRVRRVSPSAVKAET